MTATALRLTCRRCGAEKPPGSGRHLCATCAALCAGCHERPKAGTDCYCAPCRNEYMRVRNGGSGYAVGTLQPNPGHPFIEAGGACVVCDQAVHA